MVAPAAALSLSHQNADTVFKVVAQNSFFEEVHEDMPMLAPSKLFTTWCLSRQSMQKGASPEWISVGPSDKVASDASNLNSLQMEPAMEPSDSVRKVVVKNTFLEEVQGEDMPLLRQTSAPSKISLSRQSSQQGLDSLNSLRSLSQASLASLDTSCASSTPSEDQQLADDVSNKSQVLSSSKRRQNRQKCEKVVSGAQPEAITSVSASSEHQHDSEAWEPDQVEALDEVMAGLDSLRKSIHAKMEWYSAQEGNNTERNSEGSTDTGDSEDLDFLERTSSLTSDPGCKLVVRNTFFEAVVEDDMPLLRQLSAPTKIPMSRQSTQEGPTDTESTHASAVEQPETKMLSKTAKRNQRTRQRKKTTKKAESSPAAVWQGHELTAVERSKLKKQFMDMFEQEYELARGLSEERSVELMTLEELAKFDCNSSRPSVSVHGDIFDVSHNLHQYGSDGTRSFEAGSDITWAAISGSHTKDNCNCFYDVFKATDDRELASRCMTLCSTITAFRRDYGKPIGRLNIYNEEARLPPAPSPHMEHSETACPVQ